MKKISILFLLLIILTSCLEETKVEKKKALYIKNKVCDS
jgi:hypothetical protein